MAVELTRSEAERYRLIIEAAAESLSDEDALSAPRLFEHWAPDQEYTIGKRLYYHGILYNVLQAHTSQSNWTPDTATSLYAIVLIPDPTVIPEWVQPDSTNPYMKGDKVMYNGQTWESEIDNNVWAPGVYGWKVV